MKSAVSPESKQVSCKICHITDNTGFSIPHDLDENFHVGFTIGKGKKMYWLMTWHTSGNVTVYPKDDSGSKRYLSGDQIITIYITERKTHRSSADGI